MSLDGLRAWIGEVERKLGMRTRVFLVLLAISIGASGAAIYLALEADGGGLSEDEVRAIVEEQAGTGGSAQVSSLESQIIELRTQVEDLRTESKSGEGAAKPPESKAKPPETEAKPPESEANPP
jgi:TolA-binding protein